MAYTWTPSSAYSGVPPNALQAGHDIDGAPIYVGRAYHEGDSIPAKVIPSKHTAYVAWGGREIAKQQFDVLCGSGFNWVVSASGHLPPNAVTSGTTSSGEPLYVGRTHVNGSLATGKIQSSHGCIYVPFDGKEISQREYEVLVSNPKAQWLPATTYGALPAGAIIGGHDQDGSQIYIGRAHHEGDLIPAKVIPSRNEAFIAWGGVEHPKQNFEVLCNGNVSWVRTGNGQVPPNAIQGGHTATGEPLFVGRIAYQGSVTVGKVQPSHGSLYISFAGAEVAFKEYDILCEH